jgi:hypothetical protein
MFAYDDAKYGVIERKFFGLTAKHGGDVAAGYTLGTTDATKAVNIARWYPDGPIRLKKFGYYTLATIAGGATAMDYIPARVLVNGSVETSSDLQIEDGSAPYAIGSVTGFTNAVVDAGSYIGIRTASAVSDNGTESITATITGTVAFFLDYTREFSTSGKWDK